MLLFFVLGVLVAAASAVPLPGQVPAPSPAKRAVSGVVLNTVNKQPLRKAEVRMTQAGGGNWAQVTVTGDDGRFEFKDVEPGSYFLSGRRNGFVDRGRDVRRQGGGVRIEVGARDVDGVRVELLPHAIIAGRVVDEDGEPLQGVSVQAVASVAPRGPSRVQVYMGNAQTDDRGEFRVLNLNPGTYVLQFSPTRWGGGPAVTPGDDPSLGYVPMFYPGVTEAGQAERIRVTAGAELSGFQLKMVRARVVRVRGRILDTAGQPLRQFFVQLTPRESPLMGVAPSQMNRQPDGSFEIRNVVPGSYIMLIRVQGGPRGGITYREPVEIGSRDVEDLAVRLAPPAAVSGQAEIATGSQVDLSRVRVSLGDAQSMLSFGNSSIRPDGAFQIDNVPPGRYFLTVAVPDEVFVESMRAGGQDVLGADVPVPPGGLAGVRLVLSTQTGSVAGSATAEGKPLPDASILLLPADRALWPIGRVKMATAGPDGKFTLRNVPPGDYKAYAFDEIEPGLWEDDEQFRRFESDGKAIVVPKNGEVSVELKARIS